MASIAIRPWFDYVNQPNAENLKQAFFPIILLSFVFISVLVFAYIARGNRSKILIKGSILTVYAKPVFSDWIVIKTFNLNKINEIFQSKNERQPIDVLNYIPGSSSKYPKLSYFLNFKDNDGKVESVWLPYWDKESIQPVYKKLANDFPSIKIL